MGLFGASRNESHETPCKKGGFGWPQNQKNPMGWGNDKPRKLSGGNGKTSHGSKAEKGLLRGNGGLIKQNGSRVRVTGEKPAKAKRRP